VYVWESEDDLVRFGDTELARSIPAAYRIEGASSREIADVQLVIHAETAAAVR
jgi:hypothetical protein